MQELGERLHTQVSHPIPKPCRTYAVIRNPVDRLFSQVQHFVRNKAGASVNTAMEVAWEQSDIVFKPQSEFLTPPVGEYEPELRMWDMERIKYALNTIFGYGTYYHVNKAPNHGAVADQVIAHDKFSDLIEGLYKDDMRLWLTACKTTKTGEQV